MVLMSVIHILRLITSICMICTHNIWSNNTSVFHRQNTAKLKLSLEQIIIIHLKKSSSILIWNKCLRSSSNLMISWVYTTPWPPLGWYEEGSILVYFEGLTKFGFHVYITNINVIFAAQLSWYKAVCIFKGETLCSIEFFYYKVNQKKY